MPDQTAQRDCNLCARTGVRRPHGGVMVCPRCDLNEFPVSPAVMPRKRSSAPARDDG